MPTDWIENGLRQFRLALLWERHAWAIRNRAPSIQKDGSARVPSSPDDAEQLAKIIHSQVVKGTMKWPWLPGAMELIRDRRKVWEKIPEQGLLNNVLRFLERFEEEYRKPFLIPTAREAGEFSSPEQHDAALRRLLNRAVEAVTKGERLSPPAKLPPAAERLRYPAAWQAAAWLAEGSALAVWSELVPWANKLDDAEAQLSRVPRLAVECGQARALLEEWRTGQLAFGPFLCGSAPLTHDLKEASDLLKRCQYALVDLRKKQALAADEGAVRARRESIWKIEAAIAKMPSSWPPGALMEFQLELLDRGYSQLGAILDEAAVRIPKETAEPWALITLALANRLSTARVAPDDPAWDLLEQTADQILSEPGTAVGLVRTARVDPCLVQTEESDSLPRGQPPRLRAPGLFTRRDETIVEVIRPALLETGKQWPKAVALFRLLAGRMESGNGDVCSLAELFRQVADDLSLHRDLAKWWVSARADTKHPDRLGRFWQAVQRASALAGDPSGVGAAANDLLADLEANAFRFVPPSEKTSPSHAGDWLLVAEGQGREAAPLTGAPSPALQGPDGMVIEPSGWIRVPSRWKDQSQLLRRLLEAQPLIVGLRALDPDRESWAGKDTLAWDLAFRNPGAPLSAIETDQARTLFETAYARSRQEGDRLAGPFGDLARRLYEGLTESGLSFYPPLDRRTLKWSQLAGESSPPGTNIHWVVDASPAGSIVEVIRFGVGAVPGELIRSLGLHFSEDLRAWVDWLEQPQAAINEPPAVRAWRAELPGLLLRPDKAEERSKYHQNKFLDWAATEDGREAFDRLVRLTLEEAKPPAPCALVAALTRGKWCKIWPATDPATGCGLWPEGKPTASAPLVSWSEESTAPLGQAPADDFKFAPTLELLKGNFSLGKPSPGSSLSEALRLCQLIRSSRPIQLHSIPT